MGRRRLVAQTSRSFNGGFWPMSLPRFQGLKTMVLSLAAEVAVN